MASERDIQSVLATTVDRHPVSGCARRARRASRVCLGHGGGVGESIPCPWLGLRGVSSPRLGAFGVAGVLVRSCARLGHREPRAESSMGGVHRPCHSPVGAQSDRRRSALGSVGLANSGVPGERSVAMRAPEARGRCVAIAPPSATARRRQAGKLRKDELDRVAHHAISPGPQRSGRRAVSSAGRAAGF